MTIQQTTPETVLDAAWQPVRLAVASALAIGFSWAGDSASLQYVSLMKEG
jgi:hypothetical protein